MASTLIRRTAAAAASTAVLLTGAVTTAPAASADDRRASACTHHLSGPQICMTTRGTPGTTDPGKVTTAWTNPPASRKTATVYIKRTDGSQYKIKAHRSGGQIIGTTYPGSRGEGYLCVRYKGSSRTACVTMLDRY